MSIALALAGSVAHAQSPQPDTPAQESETVTLQNTRIVSLLDQLADQARASKNLAFAVRAQAQAANFLWSQDADRARSIYKRAFQSLMPGASTKSHDETDRVDASQTSGVGPPSSADNRQLRAELLRQIAARDAQLAEDLARNLADSIESSKNGCADGASSDCASNASSLPRTPLGTVANKSREDAERCELLMSAALQIVDRDPQQAMAFAQMSVALGLSSNLARLLTLMRAVDAERADLLFSNAMARLERSAQVDLTEVHTLGSYVVSVVNSGSPQPLSKSLVMRFLNFAFDQIARREAAPPTAVRRDDSAALYFIGRQLTDLFARYLPYRLDQLQRYVSDDSSSCEGAIDAASIKASAPNEIALDAIEATDPLERDSLYARAALAWLAAGEVKEAQTSALKISDSATRDRVLVQIVRRHASEKRIEDAVSLARRTTDEIARVELLVMLSGAARASKDNVWAAELLNEAGACSLKARPSLERARSLVMIASSFSAFDTLRSFEMLQSAVKAIYDLIKQQEDSKDALSPSGTRATAPQGFPLDELYAASFESTLAALAKADFDGALALARQLPGEEASVIAQLAVCGGGLAEPSREQSMSADESESVLNH